MSAFNIGKAVALTTALTSTVAYADVAKNKPSDVVDANTSKVCSILDTFRSDDGEIFTYTICDDGTEICTDPNKNTVDCSVTNDMRNVDRYFRNPEKKTPDIDR